jgi:hypothetical protein
LENQKHFPLEKQVHFAENSNLASSRTQKMKLKTKLLKRTRLNRRLRAMSEMNSWYSMIKYFCISLVDPTCAGLIVQKPSHSSSTGSRVGHSSGLGLSSSSSFGPVCGPNGCI